MKIGVSSYSFGKYLKEWDMAKVIKTAKDIGFDGIEFAGLNITGTQDELLDTAKKYKDICDEVGIEIFSYTIGADFLNPRENGTLEDEIRAVKKEVDIAKILGVNKMRHDITRGYENKLELLDFVEVLPILADSAREVTKYAEGLGIKTMFENHGFFVQNSERCKALVETINHPNFGVLIDLGNFICADDNCFIAAKRLAPYAIHAHAKDFYLKPFTAEDEEGWFRSVNGTLLRGAILGDGVINPGASIAMLKEIGYTGDISLEFEGAEDNIIGVTKGYEYLKNFA